MLRLLLVVAVLAVAVYLAVRLVQRNQWPPSAPRRRRPQRPIGPDDDPDFLRDLNRRRPRRERDGGDDQP